MPEEEFIEYLKKTKCYHVVSKSIMNIECGKSYLTENQISEIIYAFKHADLAIVGRSHFSGICLYQYALSLDRDRHEAHLTELLIEDDPQSDYLLRRVLDIWYPVKYWLKEAEAVVLPFIHSDIQGTEEFTVELDELKGTTKLIKQ
jgi:hypothetical protein